MGKELRFTEIWCIIWADNVLPLSFFTQGFVNRAEKWEIKAFRQNIYQNWVWAELCMKVYKTNEILLCLVSFGLWWS